MNAPKYEIPQRHLTAAIEGLQHLAQRLETDAIALARLNGKAAQKLAETRLEQAKAIRTSADFFLHL